MPSEVEVRINSEYDLKILGDEYVDTKVREMMGLMAILQRYRNSYLNPTLPISNLELGKDMLSINGMLTDFVIVLGRLQLYHAQYDTARKKRYNELFVNYKQSENKITNEEAKALAEAEVIGEGYDYHLSGISSWKKRLELLYDRAGEQINIAKKLYGDAANTYGVN